MSEEEGFDSRERLLSPEELADCVTRQKEFSLPTIGAKVRCTLNLYFVLITKYIFLIFSATLKALEDFSMECYPTH